MSQTRGGNLREFEFENLSGVAQDFSDPRNDLSAGFLRLSK
jgi:hypothetical protein